jgi:hypothetical protein
MKILFLVLISLSAFAQIDTTEGRYWFIPGNLQPAAEPEYNVFKLKFRTLTDTVVFTDFSRAYAMESNMEGTNRLGSKVRVLSIMVPMNADLIAAEKKQIQDLVNQLSGTTTQPPPDTATVVTKVDAELMTFSSDWQRKGTTPDPTWYGGTIAYSTVPTSSAKYNFNGKRIEIWGERKAGHGTGIVAIDGVSQSVRWNVEPFGLPVLIYAKDLTPGDHVLEVKPETGNILLDYLVIKR